MQDTQVRTLGWGNPLEKGMATRSSIVAWRIPWTEEPGWLQSVRFQRVRHDWVTNTFTFETGQITQPSWVVIRIERTHGSKCRAVGLAEWVAQLRNFLSLSDHLLLLTPPPFSLNTRVFWNPVSVFSRPSLHPSVHLLLLSLSHVWLFAVPWTVAHQAPLSMEFPGKNTEMGYYFLLQGIFCIDRQILYHCITWGAQNIHIYDAVKR